MDADAFGAAMGVTHPAVARGMSPYEIAAAYSLTLQVSAPTIYRWAERGYGNMANTELQVFATPHSFLSTHCWLAFPLCGHWMTGVLFAGLAPFTSSARPDFAE
jgi:hypothetical protein